MSLITKNGISLVSGPPGVKSFEYSGRAEEDLLGISLDTSIEPGTRIMYISSSGCPSGWQIVSDIEDRYLRLTNTSPGTLNAAGNTSHGHSPNWDPNHRGAIWNTIPTYFGNTSPSVVFPAIKFLLCEKI